VENGENQRTGAGAWVGAGRGGVFTLYCPGFAPRSVHNQRAPTPIFGGNLQELVCASAPIVCAFEPAHRGQS
jgi:hypothetical protein